MQRPTKETIQEWESTYEEYKPHLRPNHKHITQVIEYLKQKYSLQEENSKRFTEVVIDNIKMNEHFALKISAEKRLNPIVFTVSNEGNARALYKTREAVYAGALIIVGMEFETGYFLVEGSDELKDEVTAFKGLDEYDMNNYYLVANYIRCLKKYNLLEDALKSNSNG